MLNTKSMSKDQSKDLRSLLCARIEHLSLPTDLIGTAMDTVAAIDVSEKQIKTFVMWCKQLYKVKTWHDIYN